MSYHYSYGKGSRSKCQKYITNPHTGENFLICARNHESLEKKIKLKKEKWEIDYQERVVEFKVNSLNSEANSLKYSLLNLYKCKTMFSVDTYFESLIKKYISREFSTGLVKPIYVEPAIITTAIKRNRFLEFFSKNRKKRRIKEEESDRVMNEIRKKDSVDKFNKALDDYYGKVDIEKRRFILMEEENKKEIENHNETIRKRQRDYYNCYPLETERIIQEYFNRENYPLAVKEAFSKVDIAYDDLRRTIFLKRILDLDKILPEFWSYEFKGLKKGIVKHTWKYQEKKSNYNIILKSLMVKTIYDLFLILDNDHLSDIVYECYLVINSKNTKVEYWNINRNSLSDVYKAFEEAEYHHNLKGIVVSEDLSFSDTNSDGLDDDILYDLLNDIKGTQ